MPTETPSTALLVVSVLSDEGPTVTFRAFDGDGAEFVLRTDYFPGLDIATCLATDGKAWVVPLDKLVLEPA
jgi:hypothetical protein